MDPTFVISNRIVAESTHSSVNVTGGDSGDRIRIDMAVARTPECADNAHATTRVMAIAIRHAEVGRFGYVWHVFLLQRTFPQRAWS